MLCRLIVSLLTLFIVASCAQESSEDLSGKVRELLSDAGAKYAQLECFGGLLKRKLHCSFSISRSELSKIRNTLGLDEDLPNMPGKRLIHVIDPDKPCSGGRLNTLAENFSHQQWKPARHGFSSAIVVYNETTETACLLLSIAYG